MPRFSADIDMQGNSITYANIDLATTTGLGTLAGLSGVGSAEITDGSILDIDVADAAAIKFEKLASPTADFDFDGFTVTNLKTPTNDTDAATKEYADQLVAGGALGALAFLDEVTTAEIADGTIVDADVSPTAAIAFEKLASPTAAFDFGAQVLENVADPTADTDAATMGWVNTRVGNLGALAALDEVTTAEIADGTILDEDISPAAAIAFEKLASPTASFSFGGQTLADLNTPLAPTDAVTKAYADGLVANLGALASLDEVTTAEIADGTILDADISASAAIAYEKLASPVEAFDFGAQVLANLAAPVAGTDAATKAYVDSVAQGLDVKDSVRVGVDTNVDIAAPGTDVDGVTMADGDRVLLMGQTDPIENGIYDYDAGGLTRSADAVQGELNSGAFTFVEEGTSAGSGWVVTTPNPITIDTTPLTFAQFSGAGTMVGTAGRITVNGTVIDIDAAYLGQDTIEMLGTVTTGTWEADPVEIAYGGTGATTATGARANLGVAGKYTATVGDGTAKTFNVTHSLNTTACGVEVYEMATGETLYADVTRTNPNTVAISGFSSAPSANSIGVVVWG